jgi:calcineurin-like phosphoesterase family protein
MQNIFFTADTHYGQKNIVYGESQWADKEISTRRFDTLEEHDNALVERINKLVKPQDTLFHLGDWSFGGKHFIQEFRKRINCKNINLILGNHDMQIKSNTTFEDGSKARDLFTRVDSMRIITIGDTSITLSHYAMLVWYNSHRGAFNLHGHSHGNLKEREGRRLDVGVDTHNLYPYHVDEIFAKLKDIPVEFTDHHGETR